MVASSTDPWLHDKNDRLLKLLNYKFHCYGLHAFLPYHTYARLVFISHILKYNIIKCLKVPLSYKINKIITKPYCRNLDLNWTPPRETKILTKKQIYLVGCYYGLLWAHSRIKYKWNYIRSWKYKSRDPLQLIKMSHTYFKMFKWLFSKVDSFLWARYKNGIFQIITSAKGFSTRTYPVVKIICFVMIMYVRSRQYPGPFRQEKWKTRGDWGNQCKHLTLRNVREECPLLRRAVTVVIWQ